MQTFSGSQTTGKKGLSKRQKLSFMIFVLAGMLLSQRSALGQQLVDAPEPKMLAATADAPEAKMVVPTAHPLLIHSKPVHEFFDHKNIIAFSAAVAMRTADSAYTCAVGVGTTTRNADGSITVHREDSLPVNSCHGVVLLNSAFTGAGLGGSYLLHKMGHHKLERLPNWIVASVPAFGIAYTATHQHVRVAALPGR